ncbi:MAG TPA: hypothetical protein VF286_01035 [Acidiphilium sp.]
MTLILLIMVASVVFTAIAAPIGATALGTPPLRMTPTGPRPAPQPQGITSPAPASPASPTPRGSLLNLSI